MKIGIFLETFTDTELEKDPGSIARGLAQSGFNITIFSKNFSQKVSKEFRVEKVNTYNQNQMSYWRESGMQVLIVYSWLSVRYSRMIHAAKLAGLKIILKLDSDGLLLYPLKPSYLNVFGIYNTPLAKITHLARVCQWLLFPKILSKYKINQIEICNAVIIETHKAKENLSYSLSYFKKENLLDKIKVIPNPVNKIEIDSSQKQNIITCVGRWNDNRKNAKGLVKVFLSLKTEWKINLIGNGSSRLKNQIKKMNKEITISSYEKMSHPDIFETFSKTKIFFAPSISESFNLAAAEALYSGCSIVGGSLPSFVYFANAGTNGTLSNTTDAPLLKEALEKDIKKWEQGLYEVNKISSYWQKELSPEIIIPKITEIIKSI